MRLCKDEGKAGTPNDATALENTIPHCLKQINNHPSTNSYYVSDTEKVHLKNKFYLL